MADGTFSQRRTRGSRAWIAAMAFLGASVLAHDAVADSRLGSISTRGQVLTGNDVMIAGFIVSGTANKTVIVRARGPSLGAAGIPDALKDPVLELVRSSDQMLIAVNDNWQQDGNAMQVQASGYQPSDPLESALFITLAPGAYTAIGLGASGGTGVGIVEVFEIDHPEAPLIGISTRGHVLTGNEVMIGGFIIQGDSPQSVVVRAGGPSLQAAGIDNALADPTLTLVRSADAVTIGSNDDWQTAQNAGDLLASGFAPGDPKEAALLVTLNPGAYTAIVSGAGNTTGVGIVEVWSHNILELAPANTSATHSGFLGQTYTYYLPRGTSGTYTTGFLQQSDAPFTPSALTIEWAISKVPGDFGYYKLAGNDACGGINGAASGAYHWSTSPSFYQCRVDNSSMWYINVRYLDNCPAGVRCPVAYYHSES